MQLSRRTERVNMLLRQALSDIIFREIKDPRLIKIISIVSVNVSRDLKSAKIYTSVMGNEEESRSAIDTLNSASGFLRRALNARLTLRSIPSLIFVNDDSIEQGTYLLNKISDINSADSSE